MKTIFVPEPSTCALLVVVAAASLILRWRTAAAKK
ncbi:MAG: PEP-CTERM sorting domain-containing protein [Chthoniobacterales bacterium]